MKPSQPQAANTSARFGGRRSSSIQQEVQGSNIQHRVPTPPMAGGSAVGSVEGGAADGRRSSSFRFSRSRSRDMSVGPSLSSAVNTSVEDSSPHPSSTNNSRFTPLKKKTSVVNSNDLASPSPKPQQSGAALAVQGGTVTPSRNRNNNTNKQSSNISKNSSTPQSIQRLIDTVDEKRKSVEKYPAKKKKQQITTVRKLPVKRRLQYVDSVSTPQGLDLNNNRSNPITHLPTVTCEFCVQSIPVTELGIHLEHCAVQPPALESQTTSICCPQQQLVSSSRSRYGRIVVASAAPNVEAATQRKKNRSLATRGALQPISGDDSSNDEVEELPERKQLPLRNNKQSCVTSSLLPAITCEVCSKVVPLGNSSGNLQGGKHQRKRKEEGEEDDRVHVHPDRIHFISNCDHAVCSECLAVSLDKAIKSEAAARQRQTIIEAGISDDHTFAKKNSAAGSTGKIQLNPAAQSLFLLEQGSNLIDDSRSRGGGLLPGGSNDHPNKSMTGKQLLETSLLGAACPVPGCQCKLTQYDLRQLLPANTVDEAIAADFQRYIQQQLGRSGTTGYLKCPSCKTVVTRQVQERKQPTGTATATATATTGGMPFLPEIQDQKLQQIDGIKVDSLEAKLHYDEHRLRCCYCSETFCSDCGAAPYHVGMTCDQYQASLNALKCRFCDQKAVPQEETGFFGSLFRKNRAPDVCEDPDCLKRAEKVCCKTKECGHPCYGVHGEDECLPCLQEGCPANTTLQCGEDFCSICYVDELKAGPCIRLECGHVFHLDCVKQKLDRKWPGARITFSFLNCPTCNTPMNHPLIAKQVKELNKFKDLVRSKMVLRMEHEGLSNADVINDPKSEFYQDPLKYGEEMLCYYPCFKCGKPYFGGFKRCEAVAEDEAFNAEELVCSGCVPNKDMRVCKIHGTDFIEYKCRFCCSVAQWYCWGTTHFCTSCHRRQELGDYLTKKKKEDLPKCEGKRKCPLGVDHPPAGVEFPLGCAVCRKNPNSSNF